MKPPTTSDKSLAPELSHFVNKIKVKFNGSYFDFTLENCLFGASKLTKDADIDKHKYSGNTIGFDACGTFSFSSGKFGQNIIIVRVHMSSCVHTKNKEKYILIISERPTQDLDGTALTAEKRYSISFTASRRNFCLSFFITVLIVTYLLMIQKLLNSKQNILKL